MNKWLKTIVLILLSVGSVMMVTACGGKTTGDTNTTVTGSNWDQMQWDKGQWK